MPATQAPHWRLAVALPAAFWPWPAAQVAQVAQAPLPEAALNSPLAHAAHVRSELTVGALSRYSPAAQSAETAAHAAPSLAAE